MWVNAKSEGTKLSKVYYTAANKNGGNWAFYLYTYVTLYLYE